MIVGLNLKGSDKNPSVWICLPEMEWGEAYSDSEIVESILGMEPEMVVIDAPLRVPEGLFREEDEYLRKAGFDVISPKFKGMLPLVERAMRISSGLENHGIRVLEANSKAFSFLVRPGILKEKIGKDNKDLREALTAALLGDLLMNGKAKTVGKMIVLA